MFSQLIVFVTVFIWYHPSTRAFCPTGQTEIPRNHIFTEHSDGAKALPLHLQREGTTILKAKKRRRHAGGVDKDASTKNLKNPFDFDKDETNNPDMKTKGVTGVDEDAIDSINDQLETDEDVDLNAESIRIRNNLQETLSGGPSMIFAMARRMLVWDDQDYQAYTMGKVLNDASPIAADAPPAIDTNLDSNPVKKNKDGIPTQTQMPNKLFKKKVLPRWHPVTGIADSNPNFRNSSPVMNNKGYAGLIRRNSRKKNHPSLWRHSYRVYDKMRSIELQQLNVTDASSSSIDLPATKLTIQRENPHFEAALNSCAKLGLWRESISIYKEMQDIYKQQQLEIRKSAVSSSMPASISKSPSDVQSSPYRRKRKLIQFNKFMILSIVKACVRAMKYRVKDKERHNYSLEKKREPLDAAKIILQHSLEKHSIQPETIHINPLAAGYQHLGLYEEAESIFEFLNEDSFTKDEEKDDNEDRGRKNEASYSILVKSAVTQGDWSSAIENLKEMTDQGHYPKSRSLNSWSETANKRERRPRRTTWSKKRERMLMKSALYHEDSTANRSNDAQITDGSNSI
jgi:hypothetical protein